MDAALTVAVLSTVFSPRPAPIVTASLAIAAAPILYVRSRMALARSGTSRHLRVRSSRRARLPFWPVLTSQVVVQTLSLLLAGPNTLDGLAASGPLAAGVVVAWLLVRSLLNVRGVPVLQPRLFVVGTGGRHLRERASEVFLISSRKEIADGELRPHHPLGGSVALDALR